MANIVGVGTGNPSVYYILSNSFALTEADSTGFIVTSPYGTVIVAGSGFSVTDLGNDLYNVTGTITDLAFEGTSPFELGSIQSWSGLNVSFADLLNVFLVTNDQTTFNNLFFGGDDTFTYAVIPGTYTVLSGFGGNDTFNITGWNYDTTVDGGAGHDTLNLSGGVINAGTIFNVSGIEQINLGAGFDYTISAWDGLVTSGNTLTINGATLGASNHLNFNIENAVNTTTPTGNLVFYGGAGNDFFEGGRGSNSFNGGAGTDTVSFAPTYNETGRQSYSGPGVTVDLSVSGSQSAGGLRGGIDTFNSIENLIGTPWSDTLTGDAGDNVLAGGGGGADVLNGGAGNDTLIAGSNATLNGGSGDDTLSLFSGTADGGSGIDTVVLSGAYNNGPSAYLSITYSGHTVTISSVSFGTVTTTGVEFARFTDRTVQIAGPAVTTSDKRIAANHSVALSSLFSATDVSGDTITQYQLWDGTSDSNSGYFTINGVQQSARTVITISSAQLAQTAFVTGSVSDSLQLRAFDGTSWSASDNGTWAPFVVGPTVNHAPVVTTSSAGFQPHRQALALSTLLSVSDADGDAITRYQLRDDTSDPNSGYFTINGVQQAAGTVIDITAAQLAQTSFVTGLISDNLEIRAYDGFAWSAADNAPWSPFTINLAEAYPYVTTAGLTGAVGQSLVLSSLFTVGDNDGDPITRYQLWDGTSDPNSGYFTINGVRQAAGTIIDVPAAQLAQTAFVVGRVADGLQIRASDGVGWSAADNALWSPFAVSPPVNHAPVVTTSDRTLASGATVALSTLFSVVDADSDTITKYELWDATGDPNAGYLVINGQRQPASTIIDITAAQLAQTSFVMGTGATGLQIRASDGLNWSAGDNAAWAPFMVSPQVNHAPFLLPGGAAAPPGQALALPSLFSAGDADGDAITKYQLWDGNRDPNSGHFVVNGVVQSAGAVIEITAAQLSQTSFVVGQLGDTLQIRASDGAAWSAGDNDFWGAINITPLLPMLFPNGPTGAVGQSLAVSGFFNAVTPNGAITKYQLLDATTDPSSGYFTVGGVQKAAGAVIEITAAQLSQTAFVVGHVNDALQIRAFDGTAWSAPDNGAWTSVTVSPPPNHAPSVTATNKTAAVATTLALSSLFTVNDADGDTMTKYELWDGTRDSSSGYFTINGVQQASGTIIDITAAQLAQTSFVVGTIADALQIRASDGKDWSAGDNAPWASVTVSPPVNHPPGVTGLTQVLQRNWAVGLTSTLIAVSDPDGDTITKYQLWDGNSDPRSGYFMVSGQIQPARTVIEITAAQAAATVFVPGAVPDSLQVRAFDGKVWSAADNASWSPFTIIPAANTPTMMFPHDRSGRKGDMFQLTTLISTNDADLDPVVKYQLWDATRDPNSGYFSVNGVAQAAGTVIEITAAQAAQTFFTLGSVGDSLQIRVFDGFDWSAPDNSAWTPVTMTVTPNHPPVVTTANKSAVANQTLALSSLFSVSDADNDSIAAYQLWDATRDPNSGHFVVGGVGQPAGAVIQITAAQLSQTSFVTGTVGDNLQIRAMDGRGDWSAGDTATWSPFTVTLRSNSAPVVTTTDKNATAGQTFALSGLFSVTDADGDAITKYELWDSTSDPNSGHFVVNGTPQAAGTIIDITAAQLAQTTFVVGASGHGDLLQIRASDGFAWSAGDSASWAPFHINV